MMVKNFKSMVAALAAIVALAVGGQASAQNVPNQNGTAGNNNVMAKQGNNMMVNREKIKAQKIAFLTQELNLTPDEASKFWPVYDKCWKEKMDAKKATSQSLKALSTAAKDANSSESDVKALADAYHKNLNREMELVGAHFSEYQKVLPIKKAALVTAAEERFKNNLIMQLRGKGDKRKMNQLHYKGQGHNTELQNNNKQNSN